MTKRFNSAGEVTIDITPFLEDMKPKIKEHPYLKKVLDQMVADGLSEDEAFDIMFEAWLRGR